MTGSIRKSVISGSWYPGNPKTLRETVLGYLEEATIPEIPNRPSAIISPHAGYIYSGPVAAFAYKAVKNYYYTKVVVISPSHRAHFPFLSVWGKGGYETPLGMISVDEVLCEKLTRESERIKVDKSPHMQEHALEIQLPFLQTIFGSFKLCPVIMGEQDISHSMALAGALHRSIDNPDDVLVVASSDLSHFYNSVKAATMDNNIARRIEEFDVEGLGRDLAQGVSEACGGGPIMAAMLYGKALSKTSCRVLKYANSGDVSGDKSSVVGYLAAVIY
ncbi:MAG: AmmeMemoRadiSam system protein B [Deltaproteobacteria bacterium]|nr:AmmeMemoRadiSam system protein B [Deltaproteobacteria bacterium]